MARDFSKLAYRPCVGIMLFNDEGLVWIGRRVPKWAGDGSPSLWQMPQGGIDDGESPREAALRELREETGTDKAEIVAETGRWLTYDLPEEALGVALQGKHRGQKQKWFAMRFLGTDADFDITPEPGHKPEFDAWRWVTLEEATGLIVAFKRDVYKELAREFAGLVR